MTDLWIGWFLVAGEGYMSNVSLFNASFSQVLVFLCQFNCYGAIPEALRSWEQKRIWMDHLIPYCSYTSDVSGPYSRSVVTSRD
jgi:hypothetical protein